MNTDFSVLMSLYYKERPEYLRKCLDSLFHQTAMPNEIVIVKDGPLTNELETVLDEFERKNPQMFTFVSLPKNCGLGIALSVGVPHCKNELVARMDTDDVCRQDRFELQLREFEKDPNLDICGSHILEFEGSTDNIVSKRRVPLVNEEIWKYQKRRDGFNHMTVMYKKSSVLKAGNYQSCMLMEDTYLWARMFLTGCKAKNVDDYLVYARVGKDMIKRRGGLAYFKKYKQGRKMVKETGYISWWDYYYTLAVQFVVALMPNALRSWVFKQLLHNG